MADESSGNHNAHGRALTMEVKTSAEPRAQLAQAELKANDWLGKYAGYGFEAKITQSLLDLRQQYWDFGMNFTPFAKVTAGVGFLDGWQNYNSFGVKTNSIALDLPWGMQLKANLFANSYQKQGQVVDGSRRDGKPNADGTYDCALGLSLGMGVTIVQKGSANKLGPDVPMKVKQVEFSGDWCKIDPDAIRDAFCDDYATCPRYQ
ncbi:MAG: hypothetical protein JNK04_13665 [Myxococcales bacterium]|nr:hypothetical protein [Myxococcales bacterium]